MSYDFHLVPSTLGPDLLAAARSLLERETDEINPGPAVPEKETKKHELVNLLIQANSRLEPFQFGYMEIAAKYRITEDEARVRFRHIELNGPDDGNGIQITIYDDTVDVTVPYWHQPAAARAVVAEIWLYLETLTRSGAFVVYDPQLDRILDLRSDREVVLQQYEGVVVRMPEILAQTSKAKRPWWKFW